MFYTLILGYALAFQPYAYSLWPFSIYRFRPPAFIGLNPVSAPRPYYLSISLETLEGHLAAKLMPPKACQ